MGGSSECPLVHSTADRISQCGPDMAFTARSGTGFGTTNATLFSSTLSGTATSVLNGTLVECFGPGLNRTAENMVGNSTFWILGQYHVFTFTDIHDIAGTSLR